MAITSPILQVKKLRHTEVSLPKATEWEQVELKPRSVMPGVTLFTPTLYTFSAEQLWVMSSNFTVPSLANWVTSAGCSLSEPQLLHL